MSARAGSGRALAGGLALALGVGALGGPLASLAGRPSFTVHMLQVVALTLVVAPLAVLALPPAGVEAWLRPPGRARLVRRLAAPPVAGAILVAHLAAWHLVPVHAAMVASPPLHVLALAGFLATGILAWWCVAAPPSAPGRARDPVAMIYLFVLGVPLQGLAAFLSLTPRLLYMGYGAGERGFGLDPLADQQAGGLILWVPAGLIVWIAITALWVRWSRRLERSDREASGDDAPPPLTLPGSPGA